MVSYLVEIQAAKNSSPKNIIGMAINGDNTTSHDHVITFASFRPMNRIANKDKNFIRFPQLVRK